MIKLDSFLGCMKLETGGIVIGWLHMVGDVVGLILSVIGVVILSVYDCTDLREFLEKNMKEAVNQDFDEACSIGRGIMIGVFLFLAFCCIGFVAISFLCIKGTEHRDHVRVKPMMILLAILAIVSFLNILSMNAQGIVTGLVYGGLYSYQFLVLHSLFTTFEAERAQGFTPLYQHPGAKV